MKLKDLTKICWSIRYINYFLHTHINFVEVEDVHIIAFRLGVALLYALHLDPYHSKMTLEVYIITVLSVAQYIKGVH